MKILILDDQQYRHDALSRAFSGAGAEIVHVYNPDEAALALAESHFDVAYLDHDLDYFLHEDSADLSNPFGVELTGLHTAELIASMPPEYRPSKVVIHSHSMLGSRRMADVLMGAGVDVQIERFSEKLLTGLN